jgi:hypothetical protein
MPTLAKAQLIESESPWGAAFDQMYLELCLERAPILTALGFYAERDLSPPNNSEAIPTTDEAEELRQIASALTVAAAASATMPTAVLVATLEKVSKKPACSSRASYRNPSNGQSRTTISAAMSRPGLIGETCGATRLRLFLAKSNNRQT